MPTLARLAQKDGRTTFARLCWTCRATGVLTPTGDPQPTPEAAAALPGKCPDCYRRSLIGLPVGRRLDS